MAVVEWGTAKIALSETVPFMVLAQRQRILLERLADARLTCNRLHTRAHAFTARSTAAAGDEVL